jgi:hypothetical protein
MSVAILLHPRFSHFHVSGKTFVVVVRTLSDPILEIMARVGSLIAKNFALL